MTERGRGAPCAGRMLLILLAFCVAASLHGLALAAAPGAPSDATGEARTLADAFRKGEVGLSLRYRWEHVGDEAPAVADEEADASTIRTSLSFRTAPLLGFSAFVEFEDVSNLGMSNDHNDTVNGVTDHPVIADPTGTDFEQGYLRYARPDAVEASAGRMHLTLAEERYLGPVGWRQNQQSFDAIEVAVKAIPRTTLRLIYIDNVGYGAIPSFKRGPVYYAAPPGRMFSTSLFQGLTPSWLKLLMNSDIGDGNGGICFFDSGSPKFLHQTNTIVAVASGGDAICRAENYNQRLDVADARAFLGRHLALP